MNILEAAIHQSACDELHGMGWGEPAELRIVPVVQVIPKTLDKQAHVQYAQRDTQNNAGQRVGHPSQPRCPDSRSPETLLPRLHWQHPHTVSNAAWL